MKRRIRGARVPCDAPLAFLPNWFMTSIASGLTASAGSVFLRFSVIDVLTVSLGRFLTLEGLSLARRAGAAPRFFGSRSTLGRTSFEGRRVAAILYGSALDRVRVAGMSLSESEPESAGWGFVDRLRWLAACRLVRTMLSVFERRT